MREGEQKAFPKGLLLLVTDSISDASEHVFKNGREKKKNPTEKGIPPSLLTPSTYSVSEVKNDIQPTQAPCGHLPQEQGGAPLYLHRNPERGCWLTHCEILFLYLEVMNYFI